MPMASMCLFNMVMVWGRHDTLTLRVVIVTFEGSIFLTYRSDAGPGRGRDCYLFPICPQGYDLDKF